MTTSKLEKGKEGERKRGEGGREGERESDWVKYMYAGTTYTLDNF